MLDEKNYSKEKEDIKQDKTIYLEVDIIISSEEEAVWQKAAATGEEIE